VRAASGKRGVLVSLPRNRALRAASAKLVARCFKLAPGATAPEIDVALASLANALAAGKSGGKGGSGGSKAAVEGAVAGVVLASVRDMTVRGCRDGWCDANGAHDCSLRRNARPVRRKKQGIDKTPQTNPHQLNHGPPMALVLRHLADRYGRPVAIMGTRGAAARTALQRELEEVRSAEIGRFQG
jgi:hypothetical protein